MTSIGIFARFPRSLVSKLILKALPMLIPSRSFSGHPCEIENNGCSHKCKKDGDKAVCECPPGYQLEEDKKICEKSK